ncbi:MAG: RluA family pseudouridine synthase [Armatimonadetes bacterium]|nr:RluA family pseudouridine synthase [Armatimonadota bacterium]NIM24144.1 RluA family pseudouridine synthase [Armatimonadota bacterium]NIM68003.1 RluA family pseudouridine synthase [Armatimonadota bacterium]NIM76498.1 RluA family pseudouridine synthase [Armatimonadota bacterium]NIN06237.1 RluA family pseudouridine synthase [Armatimonadota bacterium]
MVPEDAAGERLDVFLSGRLPDISRSQIQRLLRSGHILVDGETRSPAHHLKSGEQISIEMPPPEPTTLAPEQIPLDIVHEDDYIIVVNKPPGLVVHPGAGRKSGTLVNALLAHSGRLSSIGGPSRPGIVHRLDKDTSGLMVVAKDDDAHFALTRMVEARQIERNYLALIWGQPRQSRFAIEAPIGRKPSDRKQMAVVTTPGKTARHAHTEIEVLERFGEISLIQATLATGRTHQVRVHLSYAGHPVVGDPTYGRRLARSEARLLDAESLELIDALPGQALHAHRLAFKHPINEKPLEFTSEPPERFARLLHHLRLRARRSG